MPGDGGGFRGCTGALSHGPFRRSTPPTPGCWRLPRSRADKIAFVYADDIWVADADGKDARRLTSHPGEEQNPYSRPTGSTSPSRRSLRRQRGRLRDARRQAASRSG